MDDWFYYDVVHRLHAFCNPVSDEAVEELLSVLAPRAGARVLDIACGHAELLLRLVERFDVAGVGVDVSPYALGRAESARDARCPDRDLELVLARGESYVAPRPFDVAICIGASWIWDGWAGTLDALCAHARPGGLVVTGEPFWIGEPPAPYLASERLRCDEFPSFEGYADGARARGLTLVWMRRSTSADWDRYEMLQAASMDHFLREHADHPDVDAVRRRAEPSRHAYLRWGKDCVGFAIWVFRTPA